MFEALSISGIVAAAAVGTGKALWGTATGKDDGCHCNGACPNCSCRKAEDEKPADK